jgi:tetratricopeptide (TPR) repeat protein
LPLLREGVRLDPDSAKAHYTLALALFSRAEKEWQRSPGSAEGRDWLQEVIPHARRATERKGDYALAYLFWGLALKYLGQPVDAITPLRHGVACRSESFELQLALGEVLLATGQTAEAETHLENARRLDAKDPRHGFGMGCAVGDLDNDGYDDLAVTSLGGVALYHNRPAGRGGRRFEDITSRAGLCDPHWATSCAWGDVDGDGLLDLYVCNYVELDPAHYPVCRHTRTGRPYTCPPTVLSSSAHRLYRNNGDGTFADISATSGIAAAPPAPGLGGGAR